jgi:hypothetical protein
MISGEATPLSYLKGLLMNIRNTICQLGGQGDLLEHHPKRQRAIIFHILRISVLALLAGCTIELKPDKAPGGITGSGRQNPPYPSPIVPVYQYQVYPGSFTSPGGYGGYGPGTQPISNQSSSGSTSDGFTIKITSR